ncbi:polyamine ABC transporter substrate-binding protein [Nitrincola tapanii]|uniref:Putrescine-binding periplasmic protein n=1 Tax=Nitrincola tapanii TaxID=1708751 RepID=A0A5A9VZ03_9GAMM|nr:polyamine ABC transporter substrate-binding protein [Nitrincola tapanii]KAA0873623.1 polyamine ABC transporter substrate-binding protein [Nitrincola tapanii]
MKQMFKPALLASGVALALGAASVQAKEVRVYNWSDYIAEDTIAKFEAETGIKVIYDVYDSNEVLESKLLSGRSGYDLAMPSNHYVTKYIKAEAIQKLDHAQLPNRELLNPELMEQLEAVDPGSQYSMPYLWGTNGYGYNVDRVNAILGEDAPTDSWALLFDPEITAKLAAGGCGISLMDSGEEMLPAALSYLGIDPKSNDSADIAKAAEVITAVQPHITYFHSSRYISDLANGEICVAAGYSGDILQAADRAVEADNGIEIAYVIPKEGAALWFDMMVIPKGAPNYDNAHTLMNFLMKPEIIADITNYVWYPNAVDAADEFVDPEILEDESIYPTDEMMEKLFVAKERPLDVQRVITRTWNRVKSGR